MSSIGRGNGKVLGGTEGEGTIIRIYYMKKNLFSAKEEKRNKNWIIYSRFYDKICGKYKNTQITLEKKSKNK